jgi:putative oxidoreductase
MIREAAPMRRETAGLNRYTAAIAPYALTATRVLVGVIFLLMGFPKFGGLAGFTNFVGNLGIPLASVVAPLVATFEVVGGLLLIAGLATRWASLWFVFEMTVTTLLVKLPNLGLIAPQGKPGVGAELDLLLLVCALVLLTHGSGPISVEQNVLKREL